MVPPVVILQSLFEGVCRSAKVTGTSGRGQGCPKSVWFQGEKNAALPRFPCACDRFHLFRLLRPQQQQPPPPPLLLLFFFTSHPVHPHSLYHRHHHHALSVVPSSRRQHHILCKATPSPLSTHTRDIPQLHPQHQSSSTSSIPCALSKQHSALLHCEVSLDVTRSPPSSVCPALPCPALSCPALPCHHHHHHYLHYLHTHAHRTVTFTSISTAAAH